MNEERNEGVAPVVLTEERPALTSLEEVAMAAMALSGELVTTHPEGGCQGLLDKGMALREDRDEWRGDNRIRYAYRLSAAGIVEQARIEREGGR